MFGSRNGSFVVEGSVEPPGRAPACGVGDGTAVGVWGRTTVPGGVVVPGIGSCPGGRVGSPGAGVGRGVDCGVCASAALAPANTMDARTSGLIKLVDIKLN